MVQSSPEKKKHNKNSLLLSVREFFSPFRVTLDPNTHTHSRTFEIGPSVLPDDNLALMPPQEIRPFLIGVFLGK
jgi:hypothetical protein